jgi:serine/threonine-protein kinase
MAYKNPEGRNLKRIAAELGVATVLEGSVQRMGSKVHLNVQLIDARTDQHLWADSYTEDLTDVFAMESSLAGEVVGALKASFTTDERALLARRPTQDVEAFDLYLQGRALYEKISITSSVEYFDRVAHIFEQAAARDPSFLLPHVSAANLHGEAYWFGTIDPTAERRAKAKAELDAAIRIAPDAPETHVARGSFEYTCNNDWRRALEELQVAEAGLPNDADLHFRIGLAYRRLGRVKEGLAEIEHAAELSPNDEFVAGTVVETTFSLKRYARALEIADRLLATHQASILIQNLRVRSKFELDGDHAAYLRDYVALVTGPEESKHALGEYLTAMEMGDLARAERALTDPKLTSITNDDHSINDPVSLHRSLVAFLQGHSSDARRYSDEAITAYKNQKWTPRQGMWVKMGIARAEAYEGRMDEALRDGAAAVDEATPKDGFSGPVVRYDFGQLLVIAGRTEEALAALRDLVSPAMPVASPNGIRYDPIWSRLKGDPRFDQILNSAKPL